MGGRPGLVVDVGANIGQESIISASFGHRALAFEPFADTLRTARFNARINCLPDTITWVNAGTSDKPGRSCGVALATDNSHVGVGIFANNIEGGDCMNITTLDATLTTDERPLILKLDNEGSEVATLRGARHTDPEGDPGCEDVPFCARGAEGFLGYPTAWLAANLGVDGGALAAFGPEGELSEATEDWSDVRTNVEVP